MISWIQNVTQRHHKILFGSLLIVITIAFVFTIGNFGGLGPSDQQSRKKVLLFGFDLRSRKDTSKIGNWTSMSFQLNRAAFPGNKAFEEAMFQRISLLHLADELSIPEPNIQQVAAYIRTLPAFKDDRGRFSPQLYTQALESESTNPRENRAELISTVIAQDFRNNQVLRLIGGPGYISIEEAIAELQENNASWFIDVLSLPRKNFKPKIKTSPELLKDHYEKHKENYASEPQFKLSYIKFPIQIDSTLTPTKQELETTYYQNKELWPKDKDDKILPLEKVKQKVLQRWQKEQAAQKALEAANDLTLKFYEAAYAKTISYGQIASIDAMLKNYKLKRESLPLFSRSTLEAVKTLPPKALQNAFTLNKNRFYSDGINADDKVIVLLLEAIVPSKILPLEAVSKQVNKDYREAKFEELFQKKGEQLQADLQKGETPARLAKSHRAKLQSHNNFKASKPPKDLDPLVLRALGQLQIGEASPFYSLSESGFVLYVRDKKLPTYTKNSPEVLRAIARANALSSFLSQKNILQEYIGEELLKNSE